MQKMKRIALVINNAMEREKMISALANSGVPVFVTVADGERYLSKIYHVIFDIPDGAILSDQPDFMANWTVSGSSGEKK